MSLEHELCVRGCASKVGELDARAPKAPERERSVVHDSRGEQVEEAPLDLLGR